MVSLYMFVLPERPQPVEYVLSCHDALRNLLASADIGCDVAAQLVEVRHHFNGPVRQLKVCRRL